jgi:hypothetical protein
VSLLLRLIVPAAVLLACVPVAIPFPATAAEVGWLPLLPTGRPVRWRMSRV